MTSIETGPSWVERLNPRHWTLVWKLVIVGLVPALLALALGVLRIADQAGSAADLGRSGRLLEVAQRDRRGIRRALRARARPGHPLRREQRQRRPRRARQQPPAHRRGARRDAERRSPPPPPTSSPPPWPRCSARQDALDARLVAAPDGHGHAVGRRTTRSSTATPTSSARSTCWTARCCASSAPRPRRASPTRRAPSPARRAAGDPARRSSRGAIRAGKPLPGDPAVVNAATAQLVNNYRDYQAALTPEQLANVRQPPRHVGHQPDGPAALGHPHRAVPAEPAGQRLGHGLRPGAGRAPTARRG